MSNIFFMKHSHSTYMARIYKDVKIPEELYINIKNFIERHADLGFRSVSEFVNSASRNEMDRIEERRRSSTK